MVSLLQKTFKVKWGIYLYNLKKIKKNKLRWKRGWDSFCTRPFKCNIHLYTPVSTMKCGLMPLCQEACLIGDVSYHSYRGLVLDEEEKISLAKDISSLITRLSSCKTMVWCAVADHWGGVIDHLLWNIYI